jgi:hypothetical protein
MWLQSPLLISMCSVGILRPQCLWLADFGGNLLGIQLLGLTDKMWVAAVVANVERKRQASLPGPIGRGTPNWHVAPGSQKLAAFAFTTDGR